MNRSGLEELQVESELWKLRYEELNGTNLALLRRNSELEATVDRFRAWLALEFTNRNKVVQDEAGSDVVDPVVASHHMGVAKGIRLADAQFELILGAECRS